MNATSSTARASTAAAVASPGSADDTLPARVRLGSAGSNARRRRRRNLIRSDHEPPSWEVRALSPLAIIAVWQSVSVIGWLPQDVLAPPSRVLSTLGSLISDGTLTTALSVSVQRAGFGFALGSLIALGAALPVGLTRTGEAIIDPPMQMLRTLPLLGLVPLFIVWFGIGEAPKILLVALGVCVPLYLNAVGALRSIDSDLYELADALDLTAWQRFRHVIIPGALPGTLVGVRQALAFAWLALIVAEQMSATAGLGFMINNARDFLQTDTIVVGLLTYAALGLITDAAVRVAERRALRWRTEGTSR